jgi:hypothetical protein
MFEDPEEHDEKIIAEDEVEIPYTDENEIDEIVNNIVSELRAFGYFPTVRTISMGGYPGAIEVSGWNRDNSSKIQYRVDIGTNVLHLRRTVTVPFPSEEPWEEEEEESEPPWEEEEEESEPPWEEEEEESEPPWEEEEEESEPPKINMPWEPPKFNFFKPPKITMPWEQEEEESEEPWEDEEEP